MSRADIWAMGNDLAIEWLKGQPAKDKKNILVKSHQYWLCAMDNHEGVIGVVGYDMHKDRCHIGTLYVAKEHRKKGIGTALVNECMKRANAEKFEANAAICARGIFEKAGFIAGYIYPNGTTHFKKERKKSCRR